MEKEIPSYDKKTRLAHCINLPKDPSKDSCSIKPYPLEEYATKTVQENCVYFKVKCFLRSINIHYGTLKYIVPAGIKTVLPQQLLLI